MISTMLSMVRLCVSVHHKSDIIAAKPITFTGEIYLKYSVSVQHLSTKHDFAEVCGFMLPFSS